MTGLGLRLRLGSSVLFLCVGLLFALVGEAVGFGVEGGIADGCYGLRVGEEFLDERVHGLHARRVFGGEVVFFAEVFSEVVKLPTVRAVFACEKDADEFPVALVNGDGGRQPVGDAGGVGEVVEHGFAGEWLAFQGGENASAVEFLAGRDGQSEPSVQRGIVVFALYDGVAASAGGGEAGPRDDEGSAHSAFEYSGFAAAQWGVAGGCGTVDLVVHVSTVVGSEDDDGFLGEIETVEGVEERTDGVVHALDHGGVGGAALRVGGIDSGAVFFDEGLLCVERRVDAEHPVVHEERTCLVFFDEGNGFFGHAVLDVLVGHTGVGIEVFELPRGDEAASGTGAGPVREIDIEAVLQRRIRRGAEMPFAEVGGGVASGLEGFRNGVIGSRQAGNRFRHESRRRGASLRTSGGLKDNIGRVAVGRGDAGARGAKAGEDGGARRRTERAGRVGAGECHTAFCESVEVRRLVEFGVTVE